MLLKIHLYRLLLFQHTAARRRLAEPKSCKRSQIGFNTQPPEGGWPEGRRRQSKIGRFNTQPPEGGWLRTNKLTMQS